jgi:hypothetical protein
LPDGVAHGHAAKSQWQAEHANCRGTFGCHSTGTGTTPPSPAVRPTPTFKPRTPKPATSPCRLRLEIFEQQHNPLRLFATKFGSFVHKSISHIDHFARKSEGIPGFANGFRTRTFVFFIRAL